MIAEDWKISDEHKKTVSAFMADFWNLIKASYEAPPDGKREDVDHYWVTLVRWADALSKKYNGDPIITGMILGYLDGQSLKSNGFTVKIDRHQIED